MGLFLTSHLLSQNSPFCTQKSPPISPIPLYSFLKYLLQLWACNYLIIRLCYNHFTYPNLEHCAPYFWQSIFNVL
jgi:hypothetical protein